MGGWTRGGVRGVRQAAKLWGEGTGLLDVSAQLGREGALVRTALANGPSDALRWVGGHLRMPTDWVRRPAATTAVHGPNADPYGSPVRRARIGACWWSRSRCLWRSSK